MDIVSLTGNINTMDLSMPEKIIPAQNNTEAQNSNGEEFTKKDLDKAIEKLNGFLKDENTHAEYEVHDKFGDIMIKIVDTKTEEVIMEVPPKKILDMIAKLCELVGVVFDKKA